MGHNLLKVAGVATFLVVAEGEGDGCARQARVAGVPEHRRRHVAESRGGGGGGGCVGS